MGAGLAEVLAGAASAVVRHMPEWPPVSLEADRVSVPDSPVAFGGIAIFIIVATSSFSATLVIRSFSIHTTRDTIHMGITHMATILTDIIPTATDTVLTIKPFTRVLRLAGVPRFGKSSCVWRVQAFTTARSTELWVLEHVRQCELTNARA